MDIYQQTIHKTRYARFLPGENRRETWSETVSRYIEFFKQKYPEQLKEIAPRLQWNIENLEVMPSMRALMTAGPALERDNIAGYNCAFVPVSSPRAFDETMHVLMCGTGVGFSVERERIAKLPDIAEEFYPNENVLVVHDSRIGWAKAFRQLVTALYAGDIPKWDLSKLRPAGSPLKTFGGRSSGPEPLRRLFEFTVELFQGAKGRKLNSLECHDLMCKIAEIVVVGGVRRSALISLSDLSDLRMRDAKSDIWHIDPRSREAKCSQPQRALANNSVAYTTKPDLLTFIEEWSSLIRSNSGERGIFNRKAAKAQAARYGDRDPNHDFGINPCAEIILRELQFCNLSEIVARPGDTLSDLLEKAEVAAILGTLQATLTDFRYLRKKWTTNCEEERLLGVSITGIMDHEVLSRTDDDYEPEYELEELLTALKAKVSETNILWAKKLGISPATSITCVKPSGTVSQLVDSSSGIHTRFAQFYERRIKQDRKDPMTKVLMNAGVPWEPENGKPEDTVIFVFPKRAPSGAVVNDNRGALEQLKHWLAFKTYWATHTVSATVYVKPDEWLDVGAWVYRNFNEISGLSFLPYDGGVYPQAPYTEITEERYNELVAAMPESIDWDVVEEEDLTEGVQTLACTGNSCEIV